MRPTNVAQMRLAHGRLFSFGTEVSAVGAPLPISFDQRRHVAMGERPGSWMAVAFTSPVSVARDELAQAWLAVVHRHGTLHSRFAAIDGDLALHAAQIDGTGWTEHEVAPGRRTRDVLREVLDATCTPLSAPSHRLCMVQPDDGPPTVVIAADHAHVDMWSFLVIVRDLVAVVAGEILDDRPAAFAEHTRELGERPAAPDDVHARWDQILAASGGFMPRFPLPLGDVTRPRAEVVEVRDLLDATLADKVSRTAHDAGVRMLAVVLAAMADVTRELSGEPLRAVFPVHSRHDDSWHDSVGWFITNAVIECDSSDLGDVAQSIREAMALGSWPLGEIFAQHGGDMPAAPGMFAISWLDLNRLPVEIDPALDAQLVSAVIETDGVMVWFIRDATGLRLRCRYPDTPEARTSVGTWLDALEAALRS